MPIEMSETPQPSYTDDDCVWGEGQILFSYCWKVKHKQYYFCFSQRACSPSSTKAHPILNRTMINTKESSCK